MAIRGKRNISNNQKQPSSAVRLLLSALLSLYLTASPASFAQHRSQIETANQRGDHFEALLTYDKVSKRKLSDDSHIAAAQSAWALSLPDRALKEFDQVENAKNLEAEQKIQAKLSKAIIHFQEGRADEALMLCQKLLGEMRESSALRARILTLAAQSLIRMGSKAQAEEKLVQAFSEASYLERSDIAYQLGELQNQLGRWDDARQYLKTIGPEEERAPEAYRLLIQISLTVKQYEEAEEFLNRSRQEFPEQFKDAWTFYVSGMLAARKGEQARLAEILTDAQQRFAPSDGWLTLLEAEQEALLASQIRARFNHSEELN